MTITPEELKAMRADYHSKQTFDVCSHFIRCLDEIERLQSKVTVNHEELAQLQKRNEAMAAVQKAALEDRGAAFDRVEKLESFLEEVERTFQKYARLPTDGSKDDGEPARALLSSLQKLREGE